MPPLQRSVLFTRYENRCGRMKTPSNVSLNRAKVDNATLEWGQATLPNLQITVRPLGFSHSLFDTTGIRLIDIFQVRSRGSADLFADQLKRKTLAQQVIEEAFGFGASLGPAAKTHAFLDSAID